jgi:hypothetical protein
MANVNLRIYLKEQLHLKIIVVQRVRQLTPRSPGLS